MSAVRKHNAFSLDRIAAGLSLEDIERELGVSAEDVQAWEAGLKQPPTRVVDALGVIVQFKAGQSTQSDAPDKTAQGKKPTPENATTSEQPAPKSESLIKSKKRVVDHGEVFTPPWLVEKMLDLVKGETERIDSRFLEPACGSGNFLVPILQRKLAAVEAKYGKSNFEKRHYALLALSSVYGIELLADNIKECRANMLDVFADYLALDGIDETYLAASHILSLNLVHGDAMTMKDATGGPINVAEWAYLGKGKFNRRDFRLDVLTGMAEFKEERSLFAHLGRHEIFQPKKSYPPMTIKQLAAKDESAAL